MADRLAAPVDYEGLADFLSALAYPVRLELLDQLRYPQALGEILLAPRRGAPGRTPRGRRRSRPSTRTWRSWWTRTWCAPSPRRRAAGSTCATS